MIIPNLLQYIYGYRYNPVVANEFSYNLEVIRKNLTDETLLVQDNYKFYKILEKSTDIKIIHEIKDSEKLAVLGKYNMPDTYKLVRIITSPMRENSDIIYLYEKKGE